MVFTSLSFHQLNLGKWKLPKGTGSFFFLFVIVTVGEKKKNKKEKKFSNSKTCLSYNPLISFLPLPLFYIFFSILFFLSYPSSFLFRFPSLSLSLLSSLFRPTMGKARSSETGNKSTGFHRIFHLQGG